MTDDYQPRRRGRPPLNSDDATPETTAAASPDASKRRRRASVGGHALKLSAPSREGYVRRFVNDQGNRIADLEELGYAIVEAPGVETHGPGSSVNRLAGTQASGAPLKTYLMETPSELYAEGLAEREALNSKVDDAIKAGRDSTGQMTASDGAYGHGSIKIER